MSSMKEVRRGRKPRNVCPRCGGVGGYIERREVDGRFYHYFVHVERHGGKRKVRRCYLGASRYEYVERFQNIGLAGLTDEERFERYARNSVEKLPPEVLEKLARILRERLEAVRREKSGGNAT